MALHNGRLFKVHSLQRCSTHLDVATTCPAVELAEAVGKGGPGSDWGPTVAVLLLPDQSARVMLSISSHFPLVSMLVIITSCWPFDSPLA